MTKGKKVKAVIEAKAINALPKTTIPEELTEVWDPAIADSFEKLQPKQQDFLLEYVQCWNGAEAYRRVYNPLASNLVSRTLASRLIANDNITAILGKFTNNKTEALLLVQKTYREAAEEASKPIFGKDEDGQPILVMEQPDYAVRVKAGEAMAKLYGFNQQGETPAVNNNIIVQVNLPSRGSIG